MTLKQMLEEYRQGIRGLPSYAELSAIEQKHEGLWEAIEEYVEACMEMEYRYSKNNPDKKLIDIIGGR